MVVAVRAEKGDFGRGTVPEGERKINLEYISANPTGPMHVGHGRWAALGDATARVMRHAGYDVYEEFYINDHGTQMDNFGESVAVRYQQLLGRDVEMPEACYAGAYVKDIAQAIIDEDGDRWLNADPTERMENFRERAYAYELAEQHRVTERFGTTFDCWSASAASTEPDENGGERRRPQPCGHGREGLHLRRGRRHLVQIERVRATRRTACSSGQRRDDVLHERRGVSLQQDGARFRPPSSTSGAPTTTATSPAARPCWPRGAGPARWRSCSASW